MVFKESTSVEGLDVTWLTVMEQMVEVTTLTTVVAKAAGTGLLLQFDLVEASFVKISGLLGLTMENSSDFGSSTTRSHVETTAVVLEDIERDWEGIVVALLVEAVLTEDNDVATVLVDLGATVDDVEDTAVVTVVVGGEATVDNGEGTIVFTVLP